jgi:hypothetical protein
MIYNYYLLIRINCKFFSEWICNDFEFHANETIHWFYWCKKKDKRREKSSGNKFAIFAIFEDDDFFYEIIVS